MMASLRNLHALCSSTDVEKGNLPNVCKAALHLAIRTLHLHDSSLWLLDEKGGMSCSFYLDLHQQTSPVFSDLLPEQAAEMQRQLANRGELTYTYANINMATWLNHLELAQYIATVIPIVTEGETVGFLLLRKQNHVGKFDQAALYFGYNLVNVVGKTLLTIRKNQERASLELFNAELEQRMLEQSQQLRSTLNDLSKAQDYQVEVEKMEALGQLVCGVAHEVNTPLGVALTSLSIVEQQIQTLEKAYLSQTLDEDTFLTFIEEIKPAYAMTQTNLHRAAKLVQDFKQTSVNEHHNVVEHYQLNRCIDDIIESIQPIYRPYNVEFVLDIAPDAELEAYAGTLEQILTNLIQNSCIHGFTHSQQNQNFIYLKISPMEDSFLFDYQDNGTGITDDVAKQIFTPFYTTNRAGGGTGLGLSIIYNLITQQLAGDIRVVEQHSSLGAHFQIRLPQSIQQSANQR